MAYQTTFERYEIKYLLTAQQKQALLRAMQEHMQLDRFGRSTIRNIYYDTDTFRLIRRSLEKPTYKEKLRIRSYRQARPGDPVFVELKKKFQSVVYKRRLVLPEAQAMDSFRTGSALPVQSQIANEIEYFRAYYRTLRPAVFLSYEREAFYALDGSDFRVTFDENILYRCRDFSLGSPVYGTSLLACGQTLMEIKTSGGMPLWMTHTLTEHGVFHTSFSKYGAAYQNMLDTDFSGGLLYA
ncbi:polyphosphate polymerase domain-containing protein [Agathobaculum sp. Marseille-P7918]|uniref:polyphosphate polymerase domain-containing protein n=1 Tax=Agathobaculum sp. Marseille-P7918 TaxID=2479843 RepID=UPI000F6327AD|nr:polyphosphate polymerase domain-containing protein [Agathobaculum sp. Marseille-P7918]